ncbi:hypothetical protein GPAL_1403 [Glaciecola pallidula DSM 14239 = ACAM 615]|uniref:Uncharacterized protein n=1 Tax=Brumicola pallidula DSM 14239 = ACAM 615 TaxID=1121922 RepID=K6ZY88_9ALTE|nr:hypothetical protein GPAL_1403 [Glaciecola pallidula DSM 14239 = ACAM 615]
MCLQIAVVFASIYSFWHFLGMPLCILTTAQIIICIKL